MHPFPPEVQTYLSRTIHILKTHLKDNLIGVYVTGSLVLGGYLPGRSDIDIQAVCSHSLLLADKERLVKELSYPKLFCPTRGCEFVLYSQEKLVNTRGAGYEINLNSGPRMDYHQSFDDKEDAAHWFIIDRAIIRAKGVTLFGNSPAQSLPEISREQCLSAIRACLVWHSSFDTVGYGSVLNACRGLQFVKENTWTAKDEAAKWAIKEGFDNDLITSALRLREGKTQEPLDKNKLTLFISSVLEKITEK